MKILFVTDAWHPQVNGVVRTLETTARELERLGHTPAFIGPAQFKTIPMPTYREIRIALASSGRMKRLVESFDPEAIHIATEGPLGWAARALCRRRGWPFTTSYHTRFPDYIAERFPFIRREWVYAILRRFHSLSSGVMVATPTMEAELAAHGFKNLQRWSRGVDTELFRPRTTTLFAGLPRPIMLYVGRIAVEKNLEAFLKIDRPGTKVLVGDGPQLKDLQRTYPQAVFPGAHFGEDLAEHFSAADLFVFPSMTDTFGLVILEAMASGLPVAAYPVQGPIDIFAGSTEPVGALDEDLGVAIDQALLVDRAAPRRYAETFSWEASARQFLAHVRPFRR